MIAVGSTGAAYAIVVLFREACASVAEVATASVGTLRQRLWKAGAVLVSGPRRVWLHVSATWPYRAAWQQAAAWQLDRIATPLVGAGPGRLSDEESAHIIAESFLAAAPSGSDARTLRIVVERDADRELIEAAVQRFRR